ncbi:PREDICTED: TMV resistance protein N-like isoform X2 [Nicotiana attenuata]|nr:PREDICTED: TMV resistance protein N-like isoform X2 [Nicotiana attenuata]
MEKIISLWDMEANDVRSIGIWGMSGIGKTEIVSIIYERYRHLFDADCFLGDVGEMYQKKGLTWLQQALIRKLLGKKIPITSEREGAILIRNQLRWKKVLVILDDVNHLNQLKFLVGGTEWFGRGSRVLITTRDKHLIIAHVGENKVYEVLLLSENDALELFCLHAFKRKSPERDFEELSREVVKYADGLPLALEILGPSFCGRNKEQWRDIIDRLKKIPNDDILGKLKIGLDGLNKDEMRIFLDIACLYNHEQRYYVERILKSCGIHHLIGISRLIEKSLLSISRDGYSYILNMHSLIRGMGENVLKEEHTNSRIWLHEEVHDLFAGKLKKEKVESLKIPKGYNFEDESLNHNKVLKRMQSLQVLIVDNKTFCSESTVTCLPSSLRWIQWPFYPSSSLPQRFEPSHLVGLILYNSRLVELWPISKRLNKLKHLDLTKSLRLTKSPNFGDMPNLETLSLCGCMNLEEVHPSLGHCRMLKELNLRGCTKLKKLPKFVSMESLETLDLRECTSLRKFPKICGNMQHLSELYVESPRIRSLPPSLSGLSKLHLRDCEDLESIPDTSIQILRFLKISDSKKLAVPNSLFESEQLEELYIYHCSRLVELPLSVGVQKKLIELVLEDCQNLKKLPNSIQMKSLTQLKISNCPKLDTFPEINGDIHSLEELTIQFTGIRELPSSIGDLSNLEYLNLKGCEDLVSLPSSIGDLSNLEYLNLKGCEDLVSLPNSLCNLKKLEELVLEGCKKLEKLPENIGDLQRLKELDASDTAISQPPPSITKLRNLEMLRFSHAVQQVQHSSSFVSHQLLAFSSLTELHLGNCNILGGLPEDFGSLHSLEELNLRGSNISCLPKSINKLVSIKSLDVRFCQNLNELELPPNLEQLYADYHLAMKSIRDIVFKCVKLHAICISWYGHERTECGIVITNQVNVLKFLQHFLRTYIQCDFHLRSYFCITFPEVSIPESFDYQFINQSKISICLNPSWYTHKFLGFSICFYSDRCRVDLKATLVCKPERKHSLMFHIHQRCLNFPSVLWYYIPFKALWRTSDNKEEKNLNDYCLFEVSSEAEACWGIRLEYENKVRRWRRKQRVTQSLKLHPVPQNDNAVTTEIGCSMVFEQLEPSCGSGSQAFVENTITTERGLHLEYENKALEMDQATMVVQKEHESQNVELIRVCDSLSKKMDDASRKRKRKRNRKKKRKMAWENETSISHSPN